MTNTTAAPALDSTTIAAIADDIARLGDALEERGLGKARISGILYGAAPAITAWELERGRLMRAKARLAADLERGEPGAPL